VIDLGRNTQQELDRRFALAKNALREKLREAGSLK